MEKLSLLLLDMIRAIIKHLITKRDLKYFPVAERLKHFHANLEKLISDPFILDIVQGYQILSSSKPVQSYVPPMIQ